MTTTTTTTSNKCLMSYPVGDCRYLPCELLADQFDDLPKADVFSLAFTVLEAGSGTDLPPNGALWHEYRKAGIPDLPHISAEFNALLKVSFVVIMEVRRCYFLFTLHFYVFFYFPNICLCSIQGPFHCLIASNHYYFVTH